MRRLSILTLALSTLALTGLTNPIPVPHANLYEMVGALDVGDSEVVLPLYSLGHTALPTIEVELEDGSTHLWVVHLAGSGISVSSAFVSAMGLESRTRKITKMSAELDLVRLPAIRLGEATLEGVIAVENGDLFEDLPDAWDGLAIAGVIGLASFPDLAVALLPSEGSLVLAPAAQGANLLSRIDGGYTGLYRWAEASIQENGDDQKWVLPPIGPIVSLTSGETSLDVVLSPASNVSMVNRRVSEDWQPAWVTGTQGFHTMSLGLDDQSTLGFWALETGLLRYARYDFDVLVGHAALFDWDIAYDPNTMTVAMVQSSSSGLQSSFQRAIDEALETDEDKEEGAEEAEADASTAMRLANLYRFDGKPAAALEQARLAVAQEPENCAAQRLLGKTLASQGSFAEAATALSTSQQLFEAWDALTADRRSEIEEEQEPGVEYPNDPIPQASSCFRAASEHAMVLVALGDLESVSQLEFTREEMNAQLPLAVGNAMILAGLPLEAEAAYRQASRLSRAQGRVGLALSQFARSDYDAALQNLLDSIYLASGNLQLANVYAEAIAFTQGMEAASTEMTRLATANPRNPTWQLAAARTLSMVGGDYESTLATAIGELERYSEFTGSSEARAQLAYALFLRGDTDNARSMAQSVVEHSPNSGIAHLTLYQLAAAEGDMTSARSHLSDAALRNIQDPAYATLLKP